MCYRRRPRTISTLICHYSWCFGIGRSVLYSLVQRYRLSLLFVLSLSVVQSIQLMLIRRSLSRMFNTLSITRHPMSLTLQVPPLPIFRIIDMTAIMSQLLDSGAELLNLSEGQVWYQPCISNKSQRGRVRTELRQRNGLQTWGFIMAYLCSGASNFGSRTAE